MQLIIIDNVFRPQEGRSFETDNVCKTLSEEFDVFPANAKLFVHQVSKATDVTPHCEEDIEYLETLSGPFFAVVYPNGYTELFYVIVFVLLAAVAILLRPQLPTNALNRNQDTASPNNELSNRSNKARPNARIPDIFGLVRSVPDMLASPYSTYVDHIELEHCYMCIGRGEYAVQNVDGLPSIRDGDTLVSEIDGSSLEIYDPFTSPNRLTDDPVVSVGSAIDELVVSTTRSKAVNGQVLMAANESSAKRNFNNLVQFVYPNQIVAIDTNPVDLTETFTAGDTIIVKTSNVGPFTNTHADTPVGTKLVTLNDDGSITFDESTPISGTDIYWLEMGPGVDISGHDYGGKYIASSVTAPSAGVHGGIIMLQTPENCNENWEFIDVFFGGPSTPQVAVPFNSEATSFMLNFTGTYEVIDVATKIMNLVTPDHCRANNNWMWMQTLDFGGGDTSYGFDGAVVTISIGSDDDGWVGPFTLDVATMNRVIANFIAQQGMYKDDGSTQTTTSVDVQIGITLCNAAGDDLGSENYYNATVVGSDTVKSQRAITLDENLPATGRYKVRARRTTLKDLDFTGQISDEVKWRDVYAVSPVSQEDFGDVTTVQTLTSATQAAVAISERQINILVMRKVPLRVSGSTFGALTASQNAADTLSFIALDPTLGGRTVDEIDFDNLYDTMTAIETYFGSALAQNFDYTFDKDNVSFEEMVTTIASAVFCTAYRQGNKIKINFEKATDDSVMLFNHRNKIPKTEKRTINFGRDFDGIEYSYVSPVDDAVVTFYVPEDRSAVMPQRIESIGVRSETSAHLHAYRLYNKMLYQTTAVEFDSTPEGDLVAIGQRILAVDNTRSNVQDGEIKDQDTLILELSQKVTFLSGVSYMIYLMHESGIVEAIAITAGDDDYHVVLDTEPAEPLSLDDGAVRHTLYTIIPVDDGLKRKAFLLTEKDYTDNSSVKILAINYDERYYQNDGDFV